jgi:hypothetical protein
VGEGGRELRRLEAEPVDLSAQNGMH